MPVCCRHLSYIDNVPQHFVGDGRYRRPVAVDPGAVEHDDQIPLEVGDSGMVPVFDPTPAYNLVNIYLGYQPVPNVVAAVSVENLLNVDTRNTCAAARRPVMSCRARVSLSKVRSPFVMA
jgi:outer membrane receptor protein involved in Fe transport